MILSLAGNLEKPLMFLYGTEWRERGYGLWSEHTGYLKQNEHFILTNLQVLKKDELDAGLETGLRIPLLCPELPANHCNINF
jgi:hypothetical protein